MSIRVAYLFSLVVLIHGLVLLSSPCYGGRDHGVFLVSDYSDDHDHHHHVFSSPTPTPTPSLRVVVHKVGERSPPPPPHRNPPKIFISPQPAPQQQPQPPSSPPTPPLTY
ncbi:pollen-specific leucine-rich repeat extensin-like protein 2 [Humulus lupulus]|uniref:pollen-specific leucine-rich repeat extensin-like protein 2 n=1 Tax=Humulus lupulus TaxID=3486 RepID=UPI002B402FF7|nr:pollen-specific leucine-rich repeat extensin-like protein 2 [Humulus lupulus]